MNARRTTFVFVIASLLFAGCEGSRSVGSQGPGGRTGEFPSDNRLDTSHVEGDKIGLKGMLAAPEKHAEHTATPAASAHPAAPGSATPPEHH